MQPNQLNSCSGFEFNEIDSFIENKEPHPVKDSSAIQSLPSELFHLIFSFVSPHDKETLVQVNKFWAKTLVDQSKLELRNSLQKVTSLIITHLPIGCAVREKLVEIPLHNAFESGKNLNVLKIEIRRWNKTIISKLSALQLMDIFKLKNTLPREHSIPFCNDLIEDAEIKSLENHLGNYSAPYYGALFSDWKQDYFNIAIATGRYKMMLFLKQDSIQSLLQMTPNDPLPLFLHATNQFDKLLHASNSLPLLEKQIVTTFIESQKLKVGQILLSYETIDKLSLQSQEMLESLDGDELKEVLVKDVEAQIQLARVEFDRNNLSPDMEEND